MDDDIYAIPLKNYRSPWMDLTPENYSCPSEAINNNMNQLTDFERRILEADMADTDTRMRALDNLRPMMNNNPTMDGTPLTNINPEYTTPESGEQWIQMYDEDDMRMVWVDGKWERNDLEHRRRTADALETVGRAFKFLGKQEQT